MSINRRDAFRFTLIELLVVVALTSMLMGLGVPAFVRMIRGNKVDECARNIKLGLEQAQMRAASERCKAAVIFPSGGNVSDALKTYRLGGFRTAFVKNRGSLKNFKFVRWLDPEWRGQPNGAMLVKVGTSSFTSAGESASGADVTGCTEKITDELAGSGSLYEISSVKEIQGSSTVSVNVGKNTAIVFTPSGGIDGQNNLFLLVSEASVDGDAVRYPTAKTVGDGRTSNYKVLKVNKLTGRVEFYDED